jgi:hypothetical protein
LPAEIAKESKLKISFFKERAIPANFGNFGISGNAK